MRTSHRAPSALCSGPMINDRHLDNPKSIKYYVKRYIQKMAPQLRNKVVVDVPAGNGVTSKLLLATGATCVPLDLFPEYFQASGMKCERADLTQSLPLSDQYADFIFCQEGIEHLPDQLKALKEFNRTLKKDGILVVTTPSYSNLKARMSYMLMESEYFNKIMPPNEIDSVWMADPKVSGEIYHGHIFLLGMQKLRVLGKLAGFKIKEIVFVRRNKTSMLLFPFLYPLILISSYLTYWKCLKRFKGSDKYLDAKKIYDELLQMNISPRVLLDEHMFVEFEKECELSEVAHGFSANFRAFNSLT